jgi:cyclophilin family peptidyl-prolyl cis-trans isomerase
MRHTIFGEVTKGMDVITKLETVKTDRSDRPLEKQSILSVTVRK